MPRYLAALLFAASLLFSTGAQATCNGQFPANTVCGNPTGSTGNPNPVPLSSFSVLFANPTAHVGLSTVNGSATTAMRSDASPPLDQSISPTWTGTHTFTNSLLRLLGSSTGHTTFTSANSGASNFTLTVPAVTDTLAVLGTAQTWTALQKYTNGDLGLLGSSTGYTLLESGLSGAGNNTLTLPTTSSDTLAALGTAQTWSALQQFNDGDFALKGSASGTLVQHAAAAAGSSVLTWPAGTTDFTATGSAHYVVRQSSAGSALTVGQLACSDLSDSVSGCSGTASSITVGNPVIGGTNSYLLGISSGGNLASQQFATLTQGGLGGDNSAATANSVPVFPGSGGAAVPTSLPVLFASGYTGADASIKIAAAIASSNCPAGGCIVDARSINGAQTFSVDPIGGSTKPITVLLGNGVYTVNASITLSSGQRLLGSGVGNTTLRIGTVMSFGAIVSNPASSDVEIGNFTIDNPGANVGGVATLFLRAAPVRPYIHDIHFLAGIPSSAIIYVENGGTFGLFENLWIEPGNATSHGLLFENATSVDGYNKISNVHVINGGFAFGLLKANRNAFINCTASAVSFGSLEGFNLDTSNDNIFTNIMASGRGDNGFVEFDTSSRNHILGGTFDTNNYGGIYTTATDSVYENILVFNNNQITASLSSGVIVASHVTFGTANRVTFNNLTAFDNQGSPTQKYGINIYSTVTDTVVRNARFRNNVTAPYVDNGTRTSLQYRDDNGSVDITRVIAAPATPPTGSASIYIDSTSKALSNKDDAGVVHTTIVPGTGVQTALGVNTGTAGAFQVNNASISLNALAWSTTAPTVASGFCSSGSPVTAISASNGTAAFDILIGQSTCGSTGTLTLPAATTGWVCNATDVTTPASHNIVQTGTQGSTTAVVLTDYARTTGIAQNFNPADHVHVQCTGF